MQKKLLSLFIILLSAVTLSGCTFETTGESLQAFSNRMNELNENYNMTADGYIIDDSKSSLTKFFRLNEKEIMLNFQYDKKNRLNEMNIVFEPDILEQNPDSYTFIYDCIKSFCQNEKALNEVLKSTDFQNAIKIISMKTIIAEADNIKMEIDTTQLGTVVTIYRDI